MGEEFNTIKIYNKDLEIAKEIINRNEEVTLMYFYKQCYPLFKSIFNRYYTGCETCKEFIDEIYVITLAPSKNTGRCQMENFRGESSLSSWLKSVCLFYCRKKYKQKEQMPIFDQFPQNEENDDNVSDRFTYIFGTVDIDTSKVENLDVLSILERMPNKRYQKLLQLRYIDGKTNEETANMLGMTMDNYYNKHKLAKAMFLNIARKEDYNGK